MRWTAVQVAETLGVAVPAGLDAMAGMAGVSIDSRAVRAGELFLAIRGPRHDGHNFVAETLSGGAVAGVVAREKLQDYPEEARRKLSSSPALLLTTMLVLHTSPPSGDYG